MNKRIKLVNNIKEKRKNKKYKKKDEDILWLIIQ